MLSLPFLKKPCNTYTFFVGAVHVSMRELKPTSAALTARLPTSLSAKPLIPQCYYKSNFLSI